MIVNERKIQQLKITFNHYIFFRNLIDSVLKGSLTPLPGEAKVWETPKGRSPECEFGEATAILKTLKLNPNAAVFEFPSPTSSDDEGINSEDVNADANAGEEILR